MNGDLDLIETAFHAARDLPAGEQRDALLDQLTADHPAVRRRVEELLSALEVSEDFLESGATHPASSEHPATLPPRSSSDPPRTDLQSLPCRFGDYMLLEKIAQGGMGVVFRARQSGLNRIVAVKTILSGEFAHDSEIERFHLEAEAAGRLQHPGIVPIFDVGCTGGQHYFSMPFIEGESLAARIKEGPLEPLQAARLVQKIASAMQEAHKHGVVHRDLKPGNVLIDKRGEPRITDFGLAKRVEADQQLTTTGMVLGTPGYMPPEQAEGQSTSTAADIYSMGAILYATLTGQAPFSGGSQLETILQVLGEEVVPPRKINRNIPRDLETICLKCLEKAPEQRYASAADLRADLERFLAGEPILAKQGLHRSVRRWTVREPVLSTHLAATLAMMLLITICWLLLGKTAKDTWLFYANTLALLIWAGIVFVLQKAQNRWKTKRLVPYGWAAMNPIVLTGVLAVNEPPRGALLSLYFLLLVSCTFFRRQDLVLISTAGCLVGFTGLVTFFFTSTELGAPSYLLMQAVNLSVTGYLLSLLARRLKRLGDQPVI